MSHYSGLKVLARLYDFVVRYDLNIFKTLYFNIKVFGIRRGWRLPIFLFGKIDLQNYSKGCILLSSYSTCSVKIGGGVECYVHGRRSLHPTIINIKGKASFGQNVVLNNGTVLGVGNNGWLSIGNNVFVNVNGRLFCENRIILGDSVRASWDCQIFDTNFHYIEKASEIKPKNGSVHIGHYVWIGNRVTVSKGAIIPSHFIVASNSLVNKDFSGFEEKSLIGGIPAKLISSDIDRIFNFVLESRLDKFFSDRQNSRWTADLHDGLPQE